MGVKVTRAKATQEAYELSDINIDALSFVEHGANRRPFKIVKREEEMERAIQSIVVPKGKTLDSLVGTPGLDWVQNVPVRKVDSVEGAEKYVLLKMEDVDADSLQMHQCGKGVYLISALLKADRPDAVVIGKNIIAPLDVPVPSAAISYTPTLWEAADREFEGLRKIIFGTLEQSGADPKAIMKGIDNALNAFKGFLAKSIESMQLTKTEEENEMTKDETQALIKEELDSRFTSLKEEIAVLMKKEPEVPAIEPAAEPVATTPETPADPLAELRDNMQKVLDSVTILKTEQESQKAAVEELKKSVTGEPTQTEDEPVVKTETLEDDPAMPKSVWTGMLMKTDKIAKILQ